MVCESCKHSVTYLHRVGVIDDKLFSMIIAGHKNKKVYDMLMSIKPSMLLFSRLNVLPKNVLISLRVKESK